MSGILQAFAYGRAFTSAPVNTVAPVVSGTATFGQTLSCTTGTWTGIPTPTFTYQWQRVTTNISGATSSTYVLVQADVGSTIRCVVTATNSTAAVSANSNSTSAVIAIVPGAPTIGTATATGSSTATVAYTAPASNGGATITLYTATASPGGATGTLATAGSGTITVSGLSASTAYTFTVKATNSVGQSAASAASNSITTTAANYWIQGFKVLNQFQEGASSVIDSSGSTYLVWLITTSEYMQIAKYTTTGTIAWSKQVTNPGKQTCKPTVVNGYLYVASGNGNNLSLLKLNASDGSYVWRRNVTTDGAGYNGSVPLSIYVSASSDNVYVAAPRDQPAGKFDISYAGFWMLNSAGTTRFFGINQADAPPYGNYTSTLNFAEVGTYFYVYGNYYLSGYYASVSRHLVATPATNQNTGLVNAVTVTTGSYPRIFVENGFYDSVNSVHYDVGTTNSTGLGVAGVIVQFPLALTGVNWVRHLIGASPNNVILYDAASDSSGNVYVVGTYIGNYNVLLVKYNSSGTIQWQRTLQIYVSPSTTDTQVREPRISVAGSKVNIGATIYNATGTTWYAFALQYPTDGSITGSYTNATTTMVISAASLTAATPTTVTGNRTTSNSEISTSVSTGLPGSGTYAGTNTVTTL